MKLRLFRCEPYNDAILTVDSCVKRYAKGNAGKPRVGREAVAASTIDVKHCHGCPVGKAHRDGKPTPRKLVVEYVEPGPGAGMPQRWRPGDLYCLECDALFTPIREAQKFCGTDCGRRWNARIGVRRRRQWQAENAAARVAKDVAE